MKRRIQLLTVLLFSIWMGSALAYTLHQGQNVLRVDFREEVRWEYWNTFDQKFSRDNFTYDRSYSFASSKMRLGMGIRSPRAEAYLQINWTQLLGLPDQGEFGLGTLYYQFNGKFGNGPGYDTKATHIGYGALSQAWIRFQPRSLRGLSLTLGRFLYASGAEGSAPRNPSLRWVKKFRISQRMIGPFDWSRVGRAFDGALASYHRRFWTLTLSYLHPTPGGFYLKRDHLHRKGQSAYDITLATVVLSLQDTNPWLPGTDSQLFYYYYNDRRKLKNPASLYNPQQNGLADCEINMLGGHLLYARKAGPGIMDLLLWGGYQWGVWGRNPSLEHQAWALAVEAGYRFPHLPWQPWFRLGYFYGSGDDQPGDTQHHTFFMMIPTLRIYSMTPSYTLMNTTYWMGQIILQPASHLLLRSDFHVVNLTRGRDYWYLGSGMMRPDVFSYATLGAHIPYRDRHLLTMWDLSLFFKNIYTSHGLRTDMDIYLSHIWGRDVVRDTFKSGDELTFFYVELRFTF